MIKNILFILTLVILLSCNPKIVEDSYGTSKSKSINGVDAFTSLLKHKSKKYISKSWMSNLILDEADLIVYFAKDTTYNDNHLLKLEAYLKRVNPETIKPKSKLKNKAQTVFIEQSQNSYSVANKSPKKIFTSLYSKNENEKTFLYFIRDTNTNISFFERLMDDLKNTKKEKAYVYKFLVRSRSIRKQEIPKTKIPFGNRFLIYKNGPLLYNFIQDKQALPTTVSFYPVKYVPGPLHSFYINKPKSKTILSVRGGDLIRVHYFEKTRFILIYNSEPFLNYSMVRPEYKKLAEELISFAIHKKKNPTIAYISTNLFPKKWKKKRESYFKIFTVFPLNIFVIELVLFLVFFLLYKWPHQSHPLPLKKYGSRSFIEHFVALGAHLKRNKDKDVVLEQLVAFRKKRGFPLQKRNNKHTKIDSNNKNTKG